MVCSHGEVLCALTGMCGVARACGAGKVREQLLYEECSLVKKEGRTSGVIDVVVSSGLTAEDERRNAALEAELGGCRVVSCRVSECLTVVVVPQAGHVHTHAQQPIQIHQQARHTRCTCNASNHGRAVVS